MSQHFMSLVTAMASSTSTKRSVRIVYCEGSNSLFIHNRCFLRIGHSIIALLVRAIDNGVFFVYTRGKI